MSDGWIKVDRETFDSFEWNTNYRKAGPMTIWMDILFKVNSDSEMLTRKDFYNTNSLKVLVHAGMIDIYSLDNSRYLIVVLPTEYTDIGNPIKPDYKLVASFYSDGNRREPGYSTFRKRVLKRDGYKCVECGSVTNLEVHHIKEYINFPDLRTEVSNGITLCDKCHKKKHKKAVRRNGN